MRIQANERGTLNLEAILSAPQACAQVKLLAMRAKTGEYIIPGQYLQSLNDLDLGCLVNIADMSAFNEPALFNMVCLAEILANAEGFPALNDEDARRNVGFLVIVLTSMMLARKGVVTVFYDKISFSDAADEEAFVQINE